MSQGQKPTVIFVHIPKAAGTTMHHIMARQYDANRIYTMSRGQVYKAMEEFRKLSAQSRNELEAIKGHMYFGLHEFLSQPSTYFTLMRDPVERVISHYHFVLSRQAHHLHELVVSERIGLLDYIRNGISIEMDNGQTRLLAGIGSLDDPTNPDHSQAVPFGACSETMLRKAKSHLEQYFSVVGLAEHFDETLILLRRAYQWRLPYYRTQNVTEDRPNRDSLSDEVLATIRQYNALDIELYNSAERLFAGLIYQYGDSFQRDLERFQAVNRLIGKSLSAIDERTRLLVTRYKHATGRQKR
jgi:hypothetical protein